MKAILIDPNDGQRTVKIVEHDGTLQSIYKHIGCSMVEAPVRFPNGDIMYSNEEAWMDRAEEGRGGFMLHDWSYPIYGRSLIVGDDGEGNDTDCKSNPARLFERMRFFSNEKMQLYGIGAGLIDA